MTHIFTNFQKIHLQIKSYELGYSKENKIMLQNRLDPTEVILAQFSYIIHFVVKKSGVKSYIKN